MVPQFVFLKQFLTSPTMVGSVIPSSKFLAMTMTGGVFDGCQSPFVVELGPGTGVMTSLIHGSIPDKQSYLGMEVSPVFGQLLKTRFPDIQIVPDDARNLNNHLGEATGKVDYIISSLPFTSIPQEVSTQILHACWCALHPQGEFRTFFYKHTIHLPKNKKFLESASTFFEESNRKLVIRNFPPAVVITFKKKMVSGISQLKA